MNDKILFSPRELSELVNKKEVIVIDVRDPVLYNDEHIPGAFNIHEVFTYLSKSSLEELEKLKNFFYDKFCEIGVTENKTVIFYARNLAQNLGAACRGYWLLSYLGHKNAGVLDGGLSNWTANKLPITRNIPDKPERSSFKIDLQNEIIADKELMLSAINNPDYKIIDNRDKPEWIGQEISPYGERFILPIGRIPGASWIEWYNFLEFKSSVAFFKSPEKIRKICNKNGIDVNDEIIIYCFKGARASNTYVALKLAGFKKVRNYFASWYEWAELDGYPKEEIR
ncbi:MAG: sulfurtransferase [Ignavibacteria bacterium]